MYSPNTVEFVEYACWIGVPDLYMHCLPVQIEFVEFACQTIPQATTSTT